MVRQLHQIVQHSRVLGEVQRVCLSCSVLLAIEGDEGEDVVAADEYDVRLRGGLTESGSN